MSGHAKFWARNALIGWAHVEGVACIINAALCVFLRFASTSAVLFPSLQTPFFFSLFKFDPINKCALRKT
jgi:hypothetical protein